MVPTKDTRSVYKLDKVRFKEGHKFNLTKHGMNEVEKGDIFFMEESTGELVTDDNGKFLMVATGKAVKNRLGLLELAVEVIE